MPPISPHDSPPPEPAPAPPPLERVADYPRPPRLEPCALPLRIEALGRVLARGNRSLRVLETFHPPSLYLPPEAIDLSMLQPTPGASFCEWKGVARYFDLVSPCEADAAAEYRPQRLLRAVWQYPDPTPAYAALAGWYAVYPGLMDGCWLAQERVVPQPGRFYGGWITSWIQGPFKGDPAHPELI